MNHNLKIVALIPARSGSKGIPHKNIKDYCDLPLICHSIKIAQKSSFITDIIVTTDSEEYKEIVEKNGAKCPFLRPKDLSGDLSTDYDFIKHYIRWAQVCDAKNIPDMIVQLRPTYPNRNICDLNRCIQIMIKNNEYTSLRTVIPNTKTPYKMYLTEGNVLKPLFEEINGLNEPYNRCRQDLPDTYLHNGCIDIIRVSSFLKYDSITGSKIYAYIMDKEEVNDIDSVEDWNQSELKFKEI
jgi:CMP-N,N'-diacetyllegionaminic acid synthase